MGNNNNMLIIIVFFMIYILNYGSSRKNTNIK